MSLVYLAGPITGLTYEGATDWRESVSYVLNNDGIGTASPLRFKSFLKGELSIKDSYEGHALATSKAIYTRDKWDVSRSDVVLVNFLGAEKVSIGTVLEIAWADMLNKPIVIAMEPDNIHQHSMVNECAGYIVPTLNDATNVVRALLTVDPTPTIDEVLPDFTLLASSVVGDISVNGKRYSEVDDRTR